MLKLNSATWSWFEQTCTVRRCSTIMSLRYAPVYINIHVWVHERSCTFMPQSPTNLLSPLSPLEFLFFRISCSFLLRNSAVWSIINSQLFHWVLKCSSKRGRKRLWVRGNVREYAACARTQIRTQYTRGWARTKFIHLCKDTDKDYVG